MEPNVSETKHNYVMSLNKMPWSILLCCSHIFLGESHYIEGLCVHCHCSECHGTLLGSASFGQKTLDGLVFSVNEITLSFDQQFYDQHVSFNLSQQMPVAQMVFEQKMWKSKGSMVLSIIFNDANQNVTKQNALLLLISLFS